MKRKRSGQSVTAELFKAEANGGDASGATVNILATRRKDGSVTLKVHVRSAVGRPEFRYLSRPVRTSAGFIDSWMEALGVANVAPGERANWLRLLLEQALPSLANLHPGLAERIRDDPQMAGVLESVDPGAEYSDVAGGELDDSDNRSLVMDHAGSPLRAGDVQDSRFEYLGGNIIDELLLAEVKVRSEGHRALSGAVLSFGGACVRTADILAACANDLAALAGGCITPSEAAKAVREANEARINLERWFAPTAFWFQGLAERLPTLLADLESSQDTGEHSPIISADMLREAASYAAKHKRPLLRRLVVPAKSEHVIEALCWNPAGGYRLATNDERTGIVPRRMHFKFVRQVLVNQCALPDEFISCLSAAKVEALLDAAAGGDASGLNEQLHARVYGGPRGKGRALQMWLDEKVDLFELADWEAAYEFIRENSDAYATLHDVVGAAGAYVIWRHPDTGEELGSVSEVESRVSDGTLQADGHVALSCLQWIADLEGIPARVEVVHKF